MLLNKSLAINEFSIPFSFLMLVQNIVCLVLIQIFEQVLSRRQKNAWEMRLPAFRFDVATKWLPVNLFFIMMLFSGFKTLSLVTVSLVSVCKNVTNVFTTFGDYFMNNTQVTWSITAALFLMIFAAGLGASNELLHPTQGLHVQAIMWLVVNSLCTSGYGLQIKLSQKNTGLKPYGCSYYNSLIATPLMLAWTIANGEFYTSLVNPQLYAPAFLSKLVLSSCIGFGIGFSVFWCISATSPTTYAMVGALNKIPLSILGILLFEEPITSKRVTFIVIGITAGVVYVNGKASLKSSSATSSRGMGRVSHLGLGTSSPEAGIEGQGGAGGLADKGDLDRLQRMA